MGRRDCGDDQEPAEAVHARSEWDAGQVQDGKAAEDTDALGTWVYAGVFGRLYGVVAHEHADVMRYVGYITLVTVVELARVR